MLSTKLNKSEYYPRTSDGEYMIAVGENGIKNKIVFTDGQNNAYTISKVIEIALDDETDLADARSNIYYAENVGIRTENKDVLEVHYAGDYGFDDFKNQYSKDAPNRAVKQDRR